MCSETKCKESVMNELVVAVIRGEPVCDEMLKAVLYEICCDRHSNCSDECPVFAANDGTVDGVSSRNGCSCFKNPAKMLAFLRQANSEGKL